MELYIKLNIHTTGTITIKNTRKKLYNYMIPDCEKEYIKEYLLKYKDTTVFYSSKPYTPEIKSYMIYIKATNLLAFDVNFDGKINYLDSDKIANHINKSKLFW